MSTGYTCEIKKGISFEKFVMRCARAFGVGVAMRDEPLSVPIPEKFEPSDYHSNIVAKEKEKLKGYKEMRFFAINMIANLEHDKAVLKNEINVFKTADLKKKYTEMLEKIRQWYPPTKDHEELKQFMIEQVESSLRFDCRDINISVPAQQIPEEWLSENAKRILADIDYHTREQLEENKRAASNTAWIKALRDSLK